MTTLENSNLQNDIKFFRKTVRSIDNSIQQILE